MPISTVGILIGVFLITSMISVVTGSTSLITVPAMLQSGIDARVAVATNMFALTWMSVGGTLPFLRTATIDRRRLPLLIGLTVIGSVAGALLVLWIAAANLSLVIAAAMLAIALFSLVHRTAGATARAPGPWAEASGYVATFVLGVYGGFFSGGYVTLLTAAYVLLFGMSYIEAIAITKVINIFSSAVATIVFIAHGLVDYRLGVILGLTMFLGGLVGSRLVVRMQNRWLRWIFLAVVMLLALKLLLYDMVLARL